MADVAKSAVVSSETHNGLRVDDTIKNSPNNDSNDLTEFSETNHTNNGCSKRNSCSSVHENKPGFEEIDSFSELSFRTTDEISLQDLIESEFAARMSNMNGDKLSAEDMWAAAGSRLSTDPLFEELFHEAAKDSEKVESEDGNRCSNGLDQGEFESNPQEVSTPISNSDDEDEYPPERPTEIPIAMAFDPFARIEEDSDYSNSNPNFLNSPDEFPFPESPKETKDWSEASRHQNRDCVSAEAGENVAELFTKTISDDNLDCYSDQNCDGISKFDVNNMSSVESVNNSVNSPDRYVAELSHSEATSPTFQHPEGVDTGNDEIVPGEPEKDFQTDLDQSRLFDHVEEDWITVEDALTGTIGAGDGISGVTNVDVCDDVTNQDSVVEVANNQSNHSENADGLTARVNGVDSLPLSSSEESEVTSESEKKTIKKKKSKKTKKSDEKENISVNFASGKLAVPPASLPATALEDSRDLANVSVKNLRARSMVDLTGHSNKVAALRSNLIENFETSRSTTNLSNIERHPIVTGVSVRALKERYCSMISLNERNDLELPLKKDRQKIRVPWSEALKSSFSKFDQLSKKTVFHVRSVDASKVQKQFNEASPVSSDASSNCKSCGKQVFQMEQIKAEKAVWHKNCFRCKECNKQLTVDTYSSNEGILYCKPHFKELFKPKAVLEDELEPASDKPDLGLEELSSLNVKSRFQVFEKAGEEDKKNVLDKSPSAVNVKRSPSILSKLAKFQKKGMDIGVTDDSLNGIPQDLSSTSSEEEEEEEEEQDENARKVVKSKKIREKPISFGKMDDVKSVWENGVAKTKEELREERKQEIQQIRSRLFMGKQVKMKEAYEQAVRESESSSPRKEKAIDVHCEKAKSIKECFEKGEPLHLDDEEEDGEKKKIVDEDIGLIEAGISKKSRSLFLELDKSAKNQPAPVMPKPIQKTTAKPREKPIPISQNTVGCRGIRNILRAESPEREVYRDPNVVRSSDKPEQEIIRTNTTSKMLSIFRQMEEKTEEIPDGPKPLKCFTPPPDYKEESEDSEEEESEEEEEEVEADPNIVRSSDKVEDEYLKQAANAARAKQLRAKFEKWEEKEREREREEMKERLTNGSSNNAAVESSENVEMTSIECTKSLRARFESLKTEAEQTKEKAPRPKVNRFVEIQNNMAELCYVCSRRVYQLEKVETSGKIFHKTCFRCMQCNCLLRMETFTLNCGRLYCLPHFKQLFIAKGNYDEGFGVDQHKAKWSTVASF
ncbi:UNVERIFIED_CONTAM: hypothetical protein PYX00_008442 [Menopon gallinae]|uniref:LIM zinc-binding domain-containing protein n=1 Tax=Menopon gallinae TaxID=328185 RepID=A0AAW2HNU5_9NEOP